MRELNEMALIGAGIGGGFVNTKELHVMNYNEAIKSEKDKWDYDVKEEHDRMTDNKVFQPLPVDKIPEGTKIMGNEKEIKWNVPRTNQRSRICTSGWRALHH
jgi:hypothetical protein